LSPLGRLRSTGLRHDLAVGGVNAFATLTMVLTRGLLAFTVLGSLAAPLGIAAGFSAMFSAGVVYLLLSRNVSPAAAPDSAAALLLAGLVAQIARDPQWSLTSPDGITALLALVAACVVLVGLLQVLFGLAGLGHLASFVPQPVLAGFMNGVALLIVVSQLAPLLGLAAWPSLANLTDPGVWSQIQPMALVLGLVTASSVWFSQRRWPRVPAALIALWVGSALYVLLAALIPGMALGPTVGALTARTILPNALAPLAQAGTLELLQRHAAGVVVTAFVLAVVLSLESLLAANAIDQIAQTRHSSRRELLAQGVANIVGGALGGIPVGLSLTRALTTEGRSTCSRTAIAVSTAVLAMIFTVGAPWIAMVPTAVLAGIMLTIAVAVMDQWTRQLLVQFRRGDRSRELRQSLVVVLVVCAIIVLLGFSAGVAAGMLISMVLFINSMNQSLVRGRFLASQRPSRRIYAVQQEQLLRPARNNITVLELDGALFFGSAKRLGDEVDRTAFNCRFLILDMQRVSMMDASGAVLLQQLWQRLEQRGVRLLLAGVSADNAHGLRLQAYGCFRGAGRADWWPDLDRATEMAERVLLQESGVAEPQAKVALSQTFLMRGLSQEQQACLSQVMVAQQLVAGEFLFRQGDAGDRLYVLTQGSITIVAATAAQSQRFVSYSPGVMLGEIAMLDGGGRTADALADDAVEVYVLTRQALDALAQQHPDMGQQLLRNMALNLAERLRNVPSA